MKSLLALLILFAAINSSAEPVSLDEKTAFFRLGKVSLTNNTADVIFGAEDPSPKKNLVKNLTLIGKRGSAQLQFVKFRKDCQKPSEDEEDSSEFCSWYGEYKILNNKNRNLEEMSALSGQHDIQQFKPVTFPSSKPVKNFDKWKLNPAYGGHAAETTHRWRVHAKSGKKYYSDNDNMDPNGPSPIGTSLDKCSESTWDLFTVLSCPESKEGSQDSFELLYYDNQLILESLCDYCTPTARPIGSIKVDGKTSYIVSFAVKGDEITGLLFWNGKKWVFIPQFQSGFPTLCLRDY